MSESPRRIVTGHDSGGRSVVLSDDPAAGRHEFDKQVVHELWSTGAAPAPIAPIEAADPTDPPLSFPPRPNGVSVIFAEKEPGIDEPLHRTETIDVGMVVEGEIHLVLPTGDVRLSAGDVFVQRGTEHGWQNRSDQVARMLFVLIDGEITPALKGLIDS